MSRAEIKKQFECVIERLYQQNINEAYSRLVHILPEFEQFLAVCDEETRGRFIDNLQQALDAMEQQDLTLLADVLQYEIIEKLDEI